MPFNRLPTLFKKYLIPICVITFWLLRFIPVVEHIIARTIISFEVIFYTMPLLSLLIIAFVRPIPTWLAFPSLKTIYIGTASGVVCLILYVFIFYFDQTKQLKFTWAAILDFFVIFILKCVMNAIGEEAFIRGYFQYYIKNKTNSIVISIVASSFVFFIAHAYHTSYYWFTTLIYGFILGITAQKSNSIWASVIAHGMGNASIVFFLHA